MKGVVIIESETKRKRDFGDEESGRPGRVERDKEKEKEGTSWKYRRPTHARTKKTVTIPIV